MLQTRFISLRRCIQKVKALFYHHWLLRYSLEWALDGTACANPSGYFNMH